MGKYKLISKPFPALTTGDVKHGGTGLIEDARHVVNPLSVGGSHASTPLEFLFKKFAVHVMSFEIEGAEAPNWFGVSFRKGIQSFDSVNIFCHPSPGTAGMTDRDYPTRAGPWPRLFRYAQMMGAQFAIAGSDQIAIVPFFNNASYSSTGLFGPNWKDIVLDILGEVRAEALQRTDPFPVVLKDVVLSDFSFGRGLMRNVRARAPGLSRYLREIWDFDGVGGAPPFPAGEVGGILYDQSTGGDPRIFHVPPTRWQQFHGKIATSVHSNIPDLLACHAASVSNVGRGG
ncbi:hypothetical protein [Corallococcus carmarthensis]|uniref:Uncharacterized protein n=1 Tax=Corallococcus carmarthensis TaxID=2316728 RepID=A0A3A8JM98_9BACT|nr:hypothetical protein [Corallococcus carmarthensis]NOK16171.1 hypothetical protein [Corallococcus carmarthensis]RKG96096.1 hypothetical protein D7X32_37100 [Corallococcus carmarthensis]